MDIEFKKELYNSFSRKDLNLIKNFNMGAIFLTVIIVLLNIMVYFAVTFTGFRYLGVEGYFFLYSVWLDSIYTFYYFTWAAMLISFICILSIVYLQKFTINIHLEILRGRKDEDQLKLEQDIRDFKKPIFIKILGHFSLIGAMLIHLNYYPQNVRLFYPYIGCTVETDTCVISATVLSSFVLAMTGFLIIIIFLAITIILVNLREINLIKVILNPFSPKKMLEKKEQRLKELKKFRNMSIEERRQQKINEIRSARQKRIEKQKKKVDDKFKKLLNKEQYGKKGYKEYKKIEDPEEKPKKPKKDEYDFT